MTVQVPVTPVTPTSPGSTRGRALVFDEPISLWGGTDPATGAVIDRHHPQYGVSLSGAVVFMPTGRGSSSASSILVEMVRLGTAPVAFVLRRPDEMITVGSLVAAELYRQVVPVVVIDGFDGFEVSTGDPVRIDGHLLEIESR